MYPSISTQVKRQSSIINGRQTLTLAGPLLPSVLGSKLMALQLVILVVPTATYTNVWNSPMNGPFITLMGSIGFMSPTA